MEDNNNYNEDISLDNSVNEKSEDLEFELIEDTSNYSSVLAENIEEVSISNDAQIEENHIEQETEANDNTDVSVSADYSCSETEDSKDVDPLRDLSEKLNAFSDELNFIKDTFIAQNTKKDELIDKLNENIDKLHKENEDYKNDLFFKMIKPIIMDIIDFRNSFMKFIKKYNEDRLDFTQYDNLEEGFVNDISSKKEKYYKTLSSYADELQDILEKNDIEVFSSNEGDERDPKKQAIKDKIPTDDKALHDKIAQSICDGYIYKEKVISPEKIKIYYYKEKEVN